MNGKVNPLVHPDEASSDILAALGEYIQFTMGGQSRQMPPIKCLGVFTPSIYKTPSAYPPPTSSSRTLTSIPISYNSLDSTNQ